MTGLDLATAVVLLPIALAAIRIARWWIARAERRADRADDFDWRRMAEHRLRYERAREDPE